MTCSPPAARRRRGLARRTDRWQVCGIACLIELDFLEGREKLHAFDLLTLIHY